MTDATDPYLLRDGKADDFDALWGMIFDAYSVEGESDPPPTDRGTFEPERSHVVTHDDEIVGNVLSFTRDLSAPGASVPAAHVSYVAVRPTHHRRGLLRRMITHQLGAIREPIAVLWASEGRIYQRFGYGMATRTAALSVNVAEAALRTPPASSAVHKVRAAIPSQARGQMQQVYGRKVTKQPGLSSRDESWWNKVLADRKESRGGYSALRLVLFDNDGTVDGYALWRTKLTWDTNGGPAGETKVKELVAVTPEAYTALWHFLMSVDLSRSVIADPVSAEEPILYLLDEPRQARAVVGDGLWVRVVDLPAALAARRYSAPLDLVLEVRDAMLPANEGRWRLRVAPDGSAACSATTDEADLACDIADLGAAYLGGTRLGQLAEAGRIDELRPDALRRADAAFSWSVAPTAIEVF